MTDLQKAELLASLKVQIKALEAEAKGIQAQMIAEGAGDKIKTSHGTLSYTSRTAIDCVDTHKLHEEIGIETYLKLSSVPYGAIKKELGEGRAETLKAAGCYQDGRVSEFYTLRK